MDLHQNSQGDFIRKERETQLQVPGSVQIGCEGISPSLPEDAQLFLDKMKNEDMLKKEEFSDNIQTDFLPEENSPPESHMLFTEKSIRKAFARKIFALLSLLLLKTVLYSALCMYCEPLKKFWTDNILYSLIGMPIYVICVCMVSCCPKLRKTHPWNYIILFLFSSSITVIIGAICANSNEKIILIGFGATTILVMGLTIFAVQTRFDFTGWSMFAFTTSLLIILSIAMVITFNGMADRILYASLTIFIFSILLIVDIQLIVSGTHRYKISPEEHIFAVIILYLDIMNILLAIFRSQQ